MTSQSITEAMQKLNAEFSKYLKLHQDMNFTITDPNISTLAIIKDFRVVSIQDIDLNHQHAALIVDCVGIEFEEYPKIVLDFINEAPKQISVSTGNPFISGNTNDNANLVFTKTVFLYTDTFDVDEKIVTELFKQHDLRLVLRDKNYWVEYLNKKIPDAFICHDRETKRSLFDLWCLN